MRPLDIERPRYTRRERLAWTDGFLAGFLTGGFLVILYFAVMEMKCPLN